MSLRRNPSVLITAIFSANVILASCTRDVVAPGNIATGGTAAMAGGVISGTDLQISGSSNNGSPNPGAAFSYTFQIKNNGPDTAWNVTFTDTLPVGTVFNYATGGGVTFTCSMSRMVVTCNLGGLVKGQQTNVVVNINAPVIASTFTNTGRTASGTVDPQLSNNAVTVTEQVKTSLAPCPVPAGQTTFTGLVMYGALDSFGILEGFEYYATSGVMYWVAPNYWDLSAPLTTVINLDCKETFAQFVSPDSYVNVTAIVSDSTFVLPGTTTSLPILRASVIQVLTHKDGGA